MSNGLIIMGAACDSNMITQYTLCVTIETCRHYNDNEHNYVTCKQFLVEKLYVFKLHEFIQDDCE